MPGHDVFAFGGLWEEWLDKETGELIESCTIITTEANETLAPYHHRMPVIIDTDNYKEWLDKSNRDVRELLRPFSADEMDSYTVSKTVNSPANNSADLIKPE
jgi:putative SOS response-associated peptidase YedK